MKLHEIRAVITATAKNDLKEDLMATVVYNMPETIKEAIGMYTEEVVYKGVIIPELVKKVQAGIRTMLKNAKSEKEIQTWASNWIPGVVAHKSKLEKAKNLSRNLTEAELRELLADIKNRQ